MARDFLLVEVVNRGDWGNPRPDGTRLLHSGDDLEEIQDFLEQKCGRVLTDQELLADGGQPDE